MARHRHKKMIKMLMVTMIMMTKRKKNKICNHSKDWGGGGEKEEPNQEKNEETERKINQCRRETERSSYRKRIRGA